MNYYIIQNKHGMKMLTNRRFLDHFHSLTKLGEGPWCISQKLKVVESQPNTASCIISTVMDGPHHRVHTEWQRPLSGVHSIMMEKFAQDGECGGGGGACPPLFSISTIHYKVVVYAPAERADTLPLFLLYPYMYSVVRPACCSAVSTWQN
jgi:hypothetical protein